MPAAGYLRTVDSSSLFLSGNYRAKKMPPLMNKKSPHDGRPKLGQRPSFSFGDQLGQYSDANMIVSTRVVMVGSAGFSDPLSSDLS